LRYLEQYEFSLARKALIEREVLLRAAPHIMRPLRFVMPHDRRQRPAWMIRAGIVPRAGAIARAEPGFLSLSRRDRLNRH
jgi:glycerol-3-phosphate dehydrogenase